MKFSLQFDSARKNKRKAVPNIENVTKTQPKNSILSNKIQPQQIFRAKQNIQKWRLALDTAEQVTLPNRIELIRIYNDIILDAHLSAVIQTRKINVLGKNHNLKNSEGEIDDTGTDVFQSAWFRKFLDLSMDSLFWGTTVIEFGDIIENVLKDLEKIPYENLNPEKKEVKRTIWDSSNGTRYDVPPHEQWNVEVLEQEKFGLLNKCVPYIIWKKNAIGAWSIRSDIFGMPLRIGKTDTRDEESRGKMIEMMSNMDVATWGVFDLEDEIQLVEASGTSGHDIYKDLCDKANSEISKLILGQTGTTDEKSFVGAAEVHERVSFEYTKSDMSWLTFLVNDKLIPKLVKHGVLKEGLKFGFDTKEILNIEDQWNIDKEMIKTVNVDNEYLTEKYGTKILEGSAKATLNGAQVTSMVDIIVGVAEGRIPKPSAITVLMSSYGMEEKVAKDIIDPIEITGIPEPKGGFAPANVSVMNDLSRMYDPFFKGDKCC